MPRYKMMVSVAGDSILPRDRTVNTFYLNDEGIGSDPQALCLDTANLFSSAWYGVQREIQVKAYLIGPPPQFPVGEAKIQTGLFAASGGPREVALCLSYYGTRNLPRTRGRMFLGVATAGRAVSGGRPPTLLRTPALDLASGIAGLGGLDVDWQVWSPTSQQAENVKTAYCDDEWDTMRSRGLRPTERMMRSITE